MVGPSLESVVEGIPKTLAVGGKGAAQDFHVVEVFHSAVGNSQFDHRFQFFGDNRLPRISEQTRSC